MQATDLKATPLAKALGVDRKTIHNWFNGGKIPGYRTGGGHLRFKRPEVAAALRSLGIPVPEVLEPFARAPLPDRIERVYVAGPSAEIDRCDHMIAALDRLARGPRIIVTHNWPEQVRLGGTDATLSPACLAGVASADLVLVLAPTLRTGTIGAWEEMGAALVLRKPVILVIHEAGPAIRFESLCHRVTTDKAALRMLRERAPGGGK